MKEKFDKFDCEMKILIVKNLNDILKANENLKKYFQFLTYHSHMKTLQTTIQKSDGFKGKWAKIMSRQFKTNKKKQMANEFLKIIMPTYN